MPSEKRRQSQRVRHEAGESVRRDTNSTNEPKEVDHGIEGEQTNAVDKSLKTTNSTCEQETKLNNFKRDSNLSKEKKLTFKNKSSGKGVSHGRRDTHQVPKEGKIAHKCSVAYEEEKEYEPVKIMPSSDVSENESSSMKKYRRRDVISNWLRYEELPPEDFIVDGEDYLMGEDFSTVLELHDNASTGGFLHLKGETSWGDVNPSHLGIHGLGALRIADLAAALSTIPFHQRLKIPEKSLPFHDIQMYNADAEIQKKSYQPDRESVSDIDINEAILKNLKLSFSDTFNATRKSNNEEQRSLNLTKYHDECNVLSQENEQKKTSECTATVKDKLIKSKNVDDEYSELTQDQVPLLNNLIEPIKSKLTVCDPKSELKETNNEDECTAKNFSFGLPPKTDDACLIKKPVDQHEVLNKVTEDEAFIKNETQTNEIEDIIGVCDSKEDGDKITLEEPDTKIKETFTLVSKTEIESLEDWLDSILDD